MTETPPPPWASTTSPGLFRRLAAIGYDCLLLAAILTTGAAAVVLPLGITLGLRGEEIASSPLFQLYLLGLILGFFCWFWVRGGQTLGMRAWRIRLVRSDGTPVRLGDALLRLAAAALSWAALGLGFLWIWLDRDGLAWHDRLSGTRLVMLEKGES